jgi:voltage-dependent anion channel protein 2
MSSLVPLYSKLGKSFSDLLKKKFEYNSKVSVRNAVTSDVTIESSASLNDKGLYSGAVKSTYKNRDFGEVEVEANTDGLLSGKVKAKKLADNLVVTLSGNERPSGKLLADYQQENFSVSGSVEHNSETTKLEATAVVGFDGFSVGGHGRYDTATSDLEDYNAGAEYSHEDFTATLVTTDRADKLVASYFHKIKNRVGGLRTAVGGRFEYDLTKQSNNRVLTIGAEHEVDAATLAKAKIDSNGSIGAVVEHRLDNPSLKLAFAAQWNGKNKSTTPEKFGLGAYFGDIDNSDA